MKAPNIFPFKSPTSLKKPPPPQPHSPPDSADGHHQICVETWSGQKRLDLALLPNTPADHNPDPDHQRASDTVGNPCTPTHQTQSGEARGRIQRQREKERFGEGKRDTAKEREIQ
jgi:hypothetical protein